MQAFWYCFVVKLAVQGEQKDTLKGKHTKQHTCSTYLSANSDPVVFQCMVHGVEVRLSVYSYGKVVSGKPLVPESCAGTNEHVIDGSRPATAFRLTSTYVLRVSEKRWHTFQEPVSKTQSCSDAYFFSVHAKQQGFQTQQQGNMQEKSRACTKSSVTGIKKLPVFLID